MNTLETSNQATPTELSEACAPIPLSGGPTPTLTEILILSDGTLLIHNLTPAMASALNQINPEDSTIKPRAFEMNP
jgi:hypothetical protein